MKRFLVIFALTIAVSEAGLFAQKKVSEEPDMYEYNNLLIKLNHAEPPQVTDNYVIFTAPLSSRFTGIAFDFEEYKTIHPFQIHRNYDIDGKPTSSVLFFMLERPATLSQIKYRMIIDGLWTNDPQNPVAEYDETSGIMISKVDLGGTLPQVTGTSSDGGAKFIYNGTPGLTVRLAGTFTNWDSWIYCLEETSPGFYELSLPLPKGTYYYNYYIGMNAEVDKTNPSRAYSQEGKTASVIVVN